jgi:hypothetical protein
VRRRTLLLALPLALALALWAGPGLSDGTPPADMLPPPHAARPDAALPDAPPPDALAPDAAAAEERLRAASAPDSGGVRR